MNLPRFFEASLGENAALSSENQRIAKDVLRLRVGEELEVIDGKGAVVLAEISNVGKKQAEIRVKKTSRAERKIPEITLLQAVPKGDRQATVIQKSVEWGIFKIVFLQTEHTVPQKREDAVNRWKKIAVEALRQSGNPFLPEIEGPIPLESALSNSKADLSILFDENETKKKLMHLQNKMPKSIQIAIGPEGGWSEAERALFSRNDFVGVCLAPYILRTDTATVSAISAIHTVFGV